MLGVVFWCFVGRQQVPKFSSILSLFKVGSHGYDDLFKSILVDAHAANIHSKFAFLWYLIFPEKKHIKILLSHSSIILAIPTKVVILDFT